MPLPGRKSSMALAVWIVATGIESPCPVSLTSRGPQHPSERLLA